MKLTAVGEAVRRLFASREISPRTATEWVSRQQQLAADGWQPHSAISALDDVLKGAAERIEKLRELAPVGEAWAGWRSFSIVNRIEEADHQVTFELKPCDGKSIPGYKAGQYLIVGLTIDGKHEQRCYSLSDSPQSDVYRVTIKRVRAQSESAPAGKVSNHFHDHLTLGTTIDVKAPAGEFVFDMAKTTPAVFLAGGVGVTPFLSMLKLVAETGSQRQVHLFYAVNQPSEIVRGDELRALAAKHDNIKVHFVIGGRREPDVPGDKAEPRRINLELLKQKLPSGNYDFFMCGPPPMMASLTQELTAAGVNHRSIFSESFGAAPTKPAVTSPAERARGVNDVAVEVHFAGAGKTLAWTPDRGTLLEAALDEGIALDSMCRAGSCKGCECELDSGAVAYPNGDPGVREGKVLPCVAIPLAGVPVVISETVARSSS